MKNENKGVLYILLSAFFFSLMAVAVKSVGHLPLAQKMFFRNFLGLIAISVSLFRSDSLSLPINKKLTFARSFFGLLGVALYYTALSQMRLSDAVIINKMSPFFVVILSVFFLKEQITRQQVFALFTAALGAMLVIRPAFDVRVIPYLIALGSAFFAGAAYTTIRKLSETDNSRLIVFYFTLFSSVVTFPLMLNHFIAPTPVELFWLMMIGLTALAAQLFMTTAYSYAPASRLSIYTYVNILFSTLFGFLLWSEVPDALTLVGTALIVGGAYLNYRDRLQQTRRPALERS